MEKKHWIILVIILLGVAGVGVYYWTRRKDDEEPATPAPPPALNVQQTPTSSIDPANYFAPMPQTTQTGTPTSNTNVAILATTSTQVRAALSVEAEYIETTDVLNAKVRERYGIGQGLFDRIPTTAAEAIKTSFQTLVKGLDKNNYGEYPLYTKYTKPELRSELEAIIKAYPNGVYFNAKADKINGGLGQDPNFGFLPSINYNLFTGTSRRALFSTEEKQYFMKSNELATPDGYGQHIIQFARNWIEEIDKLQAKIEYEAINVLLRKGWRIEGYTAPTTAEL